MTGATEFARTPLTGNVLVAFTVDIKPIPKARPRVVNGRTYTPDTTVAYELAVAIAASQAMRGKELITQDVAVAFVFDRSDGIQCDTDNLIKSTLDGMSSVRASKNHMGRIGPVLRNDAQAVDTRARLYRKSDVDRVSVVVLELDTQEI